MSQENQEAQGVQENTPFFAIEKLYVKDLSLEVPNAPTIFLETAAPEIGIQLQTGIQKLSDDTFEVLLTTTVTAKIGEKTVFLIEVGQGGIFRVRNIPDENLNALLSIACPNILFPYAREVISDAAVRAGFAPVVLQPVNFEALYAAHQEEQKSAAESLEKMPESAAPTTIQ